LAFRHHNFLNGLLGFAALGAATPGFAEHASSRSHARGESTMSGATQVTSSAAATSSRGRVSASRGAAAYERNKTVAEIVELGSKASGAINAGSTAAVKAIADSSKNFQSQISQMTSQNNDAGQAFVAELAKTIPDASTLSSSPDAFNALAKSQADLNATTVQLLQLQANGFAQLPVPTASPAPERITLGSRLQAAVQQRPPRPSAGSNVFINANARPGANSLTRLPSAYNAPRGF